MKNRQTCDCYAKLDSCAESGNFISVTQLRKLGFDKEDLTPSQHIWRALGDSNLPTLGSIELTWTTNAQKELERPVKFYVLEDTFTELILGKDFSFKKRLLTYHLAAWAVTRDKKVTAEERENRKRENERQAQQNLARRGIVWA
jgi:hypothetical protein